MLLKGLSRADNPPTTKAPVSLRLLEACLRRLDFGLPSDQALWGILCLSFFFLLRRSEIVAEQTKFKWFALRAEDVVPMDRHGSPTLAPAKAVCVRLILRGSKTDQLGVGAVRSLTRSGHGSICPVYGALLLLRAHGSLPPSWPVSTVLSGSCVRVISASDVAKLLKDAAVDIGSSPSSFGTHSLRIGGATHMFRAGVAQTTIQFQGRWVSDAVRRYIRLTTEVTTQLAPAMVSGSRADTRVDQSSA